MIIPLFIFLLQLEEKVRLWQDSPACDLNPWIIQLDNWVDAVFSALKFLAGEAIGTFNA